MKWILSREQPPDIKDTIIGYCSDCGYPHLLYYDYDTWVMPEWCNSGSKGEKGYFFSGRTIPFDYWMPLPPDPDDAAT